MAPENFIRSSVVHLASRVSAIGIPATSSAVANCWLRAPPAICRRRRMCGHGDLRAPENTAARRHLIDGAQAPYGSRLRLFGSKATYSVAVWRMSHSAELGRPPATAGSLPRTPLALEARHNSDLWWHEGSQDMGSPDLKPKAASGKEENRKPT